MPLYLNPTNIPELLHASMQHSVISDTLFTEKYPDEAVTIPTIVWSIHRRIPGKDGKETRKQRIRKKETSSNNKSVLYFGQWTTVIYQFDLYHSSDHEVNNLMMRFEQFLMESTPALVRAGVETFIFNEQVKDYTLPPVPSRTAIRSLRYLTVFTAIYPVYLENIRNIKLIIDMDAKLETLAITRSALTIDNIPLQETVDNIVQDLRIVEIYQVGDNQITSGTIPDYILSIDYYITKDDVSGQLSVVWITGGKSPETGATYYIYYEKVDEYLEIDTLRTL